MTIVEGSEGIGNLSKVFLLQKDDGTIASLFGGPRLPSVVSLRSV
jgi:hypothetical protein